MARRTQTYAVRLAVEGGGQVKAELVSVGQSGEQSLKRIEAGGGKASRGLAPKREKAAKHNLYLSTKNVRRFSLSIPDGCA